MARPQRSKKSDAISLNCYTIRFTEKNTTLPVTIKTVLNGRSFKQLMTEFERDYKALAYENDNRDRMIYMSETITKNDTIFSGVMKKGYNGQETDIDELVDGKPNTVSKVNADQYNSQYFYFLVALENESANYFVFLAQSQGVFGFKELFAESYRSYVNGRFDNQYSCVISPITLPSLVSKYLKEGDVRKLRFVKHELTKNAENLLGENDNRDEKNYEVETSIRAKKQGFTGIKKMDLENSSFVEVYGDIGIEFDEAYAEVSIHGRRRSLNITSPDKFTASFDVSDRISLDPTTKKPDYPELDVEAIKILNEEIFKNQ